MRQLQNFPPTRWLGCSIGPTSARPARTWIAAAGGINDSNAAACAKAGADILVTSARYNGPAARRSGAHHGCLIAENPNWQPETEISERRHEPGSRPGPGPCAAEMDPLAGTRSRMIARITPVARSWPSVASDYLSLPRSRHIGRRIRVRRRARRSAAIQCSQETVSCNRSSPVVSGRRSRRKAPAGGLCLGLRRWCEGPLVDQRAAGDE